MVGFLGIPKLVSWFRSRHSWRKATFSEISALYTAKVLRLLALNLVSAFVLVYLYRAGHSITYIAIFSAYRAFVNLLMTPLAAILVARLGAKRIILLSNLIYIPAIICYTNLSSDFSIALGGFLQSLTITLYQLAHDVIFSEVKSDDNAGTEIGYMAIFERATAILSPLIGGVISTFASPTVVIMIASVLFVASTWPLFKTQDTAKKQHYFAPLAFPFRKYAREMFFQIAPGFNTTVDKVWSLLLVAVIFAQQNSYLVTGVVSSVGGAIAVATAFVVGKLLDRRRRYGYIIFNSSTVLGAALVALRAFVCTPLAAGATIISSNMTSTARGIATLREQFSRADRSGTRVTYMMYRHLFWHLFAFVGCLVWIAAMVITLDEVTGMRIFLVIASVVASSFSLTGYWSEP